MFVKYVLSADEIICLQSESDTQPLNGKTNEQQTMKK
jgi:hypothetical protein